MTAIRIPVFPQCLVAAAAWAIAASLPAAAAITSPLTGNYTVSTSESIGALTIGNNTPATPATLTLASGGTLTVTGANPAFLVGTPGNPYAAVNQTGGTLTLTSTSVILGYNSASSTYTGQSTYNLASGSIGLTSYTIVGYHAPADFIQTGGSIVTTRDDTALNVALFNAGNYAISGGSFEATGTPYIGSPSLQVSTHDAAGTLTVGGGASTAAVALKGWMAMANNADNDTDEGSATVNLLPNGTLAVNTNIYRGRPDYVVSNGTGTVTFNLGGGTLRPYNANLAVGNANNGHGANAVFDLNLLSATTSTLTGIGWKDSVARTLSIYSKLTGGGGLAIGGGTAELRHAANDFTGNTTISAGTLKLITTGTNNVANSPTILVASGATLDVTGVTGPGGFVLASGQTLTGAGAVTGALTATGTPGNLATVSPGSSIGTLSTGSVTLGDYSDLILEVGGAGQNDKLAVTGNLILTSTLDRLDLSPVGGWLGSYTLATWTGSISGEFSQVYYNNVLMPNPTAAGGINGNYRLIYDAGSKMLLLIPEPSPLALAGLMAGGQLLRRRRGG